MADQDEFVAGETVRLKSGAFQLFTGRVVSVNKEERTLKVAVSVLGKWRTVELRFSEVEKVACRATPIQDTARDSATHFYPTTRRGGVLTNMTRGNTIGRISLAPARVTVLDVPVLKLTLSRIRLAD